MYFEILQCMEHLNPWLWIEDFFNLWKGELSLFKISRNPVII